MRLASRLASWLAIVLGALLVGLLAAPALAGRASTGAAHARRNGVEHARAAATAPKAGEWASDQRLAKSCGQVAKGWKKGNGGSPRRAAKRCAPVGPGSVVRTAPVRRQTAQPTPTTVPTPTAPPAPATTTSTTSPPVAPTTTTI